MGTRGTILLRTSDEERSTLSLYAFSSDLSATLMRSRLCSSNVCQFGVRFSSSLEDVTNEIAVELSRLRLSGSMAKITLR